MFYLETVLQFEVEAVEEFNEKMKSLDVFVDELEDEEEGIFTHQFGAETEKELSEFLKFLVKKEEISFSSALKAWEERESY